MEALFPEALGFNIRSEELIFLQDYWSTTTFNLLDRYSAVITISILNKKVRMNILCCSQNIQIVYTSHILKVFESTNIVHVEVHRI